MDRELPWTNDTEVGSIPTHGQPTPELTKTHIVGKAVAVSQENQGAALPLVDACQRSKSRILCLASSDQRGVGQKIWPVVIERAERLDIRPIPLDSLIYGFHVKSVSWRILAWNLEGPPYIALIVEPAPRALLQRLVVRLGRRVGWLQLEVAHRLNTTLILNPTSRGADSSH